MTINELPSMRGVAAQWLTCLTCYQSDVSV